MKISSSNEKYRRKNFFVSNKRNHLKQFKEKNLMAAYYKPHIILSLLLEDSFCQSPPLIG